MATISSHITIDVNAVKSEISKSGLYIRKIKVLGNYLYSDNSDNSHVF